MDTNDLIAWQYGGKGEELISGIGIMLALPVVMYITYIAVRLLRTPPNAESKAVMTVQTKRWRIWCQSIMFGWYMVLFATGMTARPVTNPQTFLLVPGHDVRLPDISFFYRPLVLRVDVPCGHTAGLHHAVLQF